MIKTRVSTDKYREGWDRVFLVEKSISSKPIKYRIISNKIQCVKCKDIIESKYRWDYKSCWCGTVSVDGGKDYLQRGYKEDLNDYIELSEVEEIV